MGWHRSGYAALLFGMEWGKLGQLRRARIERFPRARWREGGRGDPSLCIRGRIEVRTERQPKGRAWRHVGAIELGCEGGGSAATRPRFTEMYASLPAAAAARAQAEAGLTPRRTSVLRSCCSMHPPLVCSGSRWPAGEDWRSGPERGGCGWERHA